MKGGVTKRVEQAIEALDKGQVKKALFVLDTDKTTRHHQIVASAARKCLSEKESCPVNLKEARNKLKDTITAALDVTDLEGVEEMLEERPEDGREPSGPELSELTDEELYRNCEECHVATAVSRFVEVCDEEPGVGTSCKLISKNLKDETTEPVVWIKTMIQVAEQTEGEPKEKMTAALSELADYLEKRDSPFLKGL